LLKEDVVTAPTPPAFERPLDLHGLHTYDLEARPSKVFREDLGQPLGPGATVEEWFDALPRQLAANHLRRVRHHLARAHAEGRTVVAALGGHVIKTGCGPYLIDWLRRGLLKAVAMNGAAALHDVELALAGKTSEDVGATLHEGKFGMARDTADAFALAARAGAERETGLGAALGRYLDGRRCPHADASLVLAAYRAGVPCTVHVALGTDVVHMHPHVCGAALGESSLLDFRHLCRVVAGMRHGVWLNLGSAVVLPEVLLKAVSVVRNLGYGLDGLVTVNVDKEARYRTTVNVVGRPAAAGEGLDLTGHHEVLIPLLHAALAGQLASAAGPAAARAA
jgi:hypothetical protein